ncbi:MAG TPA: carboxypeptidase regulatory-like domain-containing protein [Blastocatellia bacterium]|nr:carboxypeptidase regulatory-like domain-containing protein [Blastocatellia bacterium]
MSSRVLCGLILLLIGTFLVANCSKTDDTETRSKGPLYKPTGNEATLTGEITFSGTPPQPRPLDMSGDKYCAESPGSKESQQVIVHDGRLGNVFVYIKSGGAIDHFSFAPPSTPAILDQKYCLYEPHVLGIMVGQTLKVINSDQTGHNVHPTPSKNKEWNESQLAGGPPKEKSFTRSEVMIPVRCNQHPWMSAFIGVLHHPFYAVSSDKDGSYTIGGLPPGSYVIAAWHEKYGEKTQKVTVGLKEAQTVNFDFNSGSAYAQTSLKVEQALVLP